MLASRNGESRNGRPPVSGPRLMIAAVTEQARLVVLHVDKDFELIADITGQPIERLP
ncbi:MAG: hypothetical protein ACT4NP_03840 [Pseudonocardiales bacterium]